MVGFGRRFQSFGIFVSVLVFTVSLRLAFTKLSENEQDLFRTRLSISVVIGIVLSITVGSYAEFFPELEPILRNLSEQLRSEILKFLRQGNRSLSLMPIFLFLVSGFYWQKSRLFLSFYSLPLFTLSPIQTVRPLCLACWAGLFYLRWHGSSAKTSGRYFSAFSLGLLISPFVFIRALKTNGSKIMRRPLLNKSHRKFAPMALFYLCRRGFKTPRIRLRV